MKRVFVTLIVLMFVLIHIIYVFGDGGSPFMKIEIVGIDYEFADKQSEYFVNVDNKTSSIAIKAKVKEGFRLYINNEEVENDSEINIDLNVGYNLVLLTAKSPEGDKINKRVAVRRMQDENILYKEKYRPQFHNSTQINLMNDPNGLVYNDYTKEYHLFYQQDNAFEKGVETKSWAHAVSKDLVHWKDLGLAIMPDDLGEIFSGSCVIDRYNTSGLFPDDVPEGSRMVALYTSYAGRIGDSYYGIEKQGLAYSLDHGVTWIKCDKNPIIKNGENHKQVFTTGFRDPKVIWYEDSSYENNGIWIMVVAGGQARIYTSTNLVNWTYNGVCTYSNGRRPIEAECPDLFPMPVNGDENNVKWVFCGSDFNGGDSSIFYIVGDLIKDDEGNFKFVAETEKSESINANNEVYAAQTFFNTDRRISISWMRDWVYFNEEDNIKNWLGTHTLPVELKLVTDSKGNYRLKYTLVEEVELLRDKLLFSIEDKKVGSEDGNLLRELNAKLYDIELVVDIGTAQEFGFDLRSKDSEKTTVKYVVKDNKLILDRSKSGKGVSNPVYMMDVKPMEGNLVKLQILVDSSIIDVYANDGAAMCNTQIYPGDESTDMNFFVSGGEVTIKSMKIFGMKSIWENWQEPYVPGQPDTQDEVVEKRSNVFKYVTYSLGVVLLAVLGVFIGVMASGKKIDCKK